MELSPLIKYPTNNVKITPVKRFYKKKIENYRVVLESTVRRDYNAMGGKNTLRK